jgi:hypothetical protein
MKWLAVEVPLSSSDNNFRLRGWSTGPNGTDLRRAEARQKYVGAGNT